MSNHAKYRVFLAVWCLLVISSCRHDDEGNGNLPNPCQALKASSLAFHYLEYTGTPTADTAYNNQPITFVGPGAPYTAYEWLVGPVTKRTSKQFVLSFDANTLGNIPVRLIEIGRAHV